MNDDEVLMNLQTPCRLSLQRLTRDNGASRKLFTTYSHDLRITAMRSAMGHGECFTVLGPSNGFL